MVQLVVDTGIITRIISIVVLSSVRPWPGEGGAEDVSQEWTSCGGSFGMRTVAAHPRLADHIQEVFDIKER